MMKLGNTQGLVLAACLMAEAGAKVFADTTLPTLPTNDSPRPELTGLATKMTARHPTIGELSNLKDIAAAYRLYEQYDERPKDDKDLVAHLKLDWARACRPIAAEINSAKEFTVQEPLSLSVAGQTYVLHKIAHNESTREIYLKYFTTLTNATVLCEQNLSYFVGKKGVEASDHAVVMLHPKEKPWAEFFNGLQFSPSIGADELANRVYPIHPIYDGSPLEATLQTGGISNAVNITLAPVETLGTAAIPTPIALELKEKNGDSLNAVEARSAYLAELSRRLHSDNAPQHIAAGSAHIEQIAWFLQHPTKDAHILALAEQDARTLNERGTLTRAPRWIWARGYGPWYNLGQYGLGGMLATFGYLSIWLLKEKKKTEAKARQRSGAEPQTLTDTNS